MEIKEISNPPVGGKNIWEGFLAGCREKTFLQSWHWGEFNQKMGNKIWRLAVSDGKNLAALALVAKITAKRGTFLLLQHGPCLAQPAFKHKILQTLLNELKDIGQQEKADFIRMNPLWENNQENQRLFRSYGFKKAAMHANAYEATLRLDLLPSEQELLKNMRKTTRYLIRQTEKNQQITVEKSQKIEDIKKYQLLNEQVAKKQRFVPFSFEYVKNEFAAFLKEEKVLFFFGKYKKETVAAALIIFWSGIAFYHQAASSPKQAKLSIPYLILWEAIKEAKKRNCFLFDLWGYVNPSLEKKHPWAGPTLFKMGFGSQPREYLKTQDFPLSKKYWLIFIFEKLRKLKRRL